MRIFITPKFKKAYDKLPADKVKKTKKAISLLKRDVFYPSLRAKKMSGIENTWEARVDRSYRLTFQKEEDVIILQTIGPHDEGLGKK